MGGHLAYRLFLPPDLDGITSLARLCHKIVAAHALRVAELIELSTDCYARQGVHHRAILFIGQS
jgi:hypothetical protein